ncbi:Cytosolic iron-sulfur assembly component 2B [Malassezia psittaci]|uniref:Cytosolic iron-sulfur assembly component 2B n=1 Tax=Malassezia psittaci TaxID=1821823 RepID=A0AAF0FA21_9BASI|nr:Cytosolic iron-sulfur assembly component 2B [Malassezia psittaci]
MDNANPVVYATQALQPRDGELDAISNSTQWWRDDRLAPQTALFDSGDDSGDEHEEDRDMKPECMDAREVFDLVRSITDPEHPLTLEQLAVVKEEHITVDEGDVTAKRAPQILLEFTPTIPHCSMATLIGLSLRVRLLRALPSRYKVTIRIREGTHQSENAINKQLQDKERVAAALENKHLLGVVQGCLATSAQRGTGSTDMAQGSPLLST